MKNKGCLTALVPLIIFGGAITGMILMISGGESENTELMIVGGVLIAAGIIVGSVLNKVILRINKNKSANADVGTPSVTPDADAIVDDDDDDDDQSDDRLNEILRIAKPAKKSVDALMDREDALTELMSRNGMDDLGEKYVEEADPLWDTYTGEYMCDAVDKLFDLVDKYYALYNERLAAREVGTDAIENAPYVDTALSQTAERRDEGGDKIVKDEPVFVRKEGTPVATVPPLHSIDGKKQKEELTPPPVSEQANAGKKPTAAVGYKPMKKK